MTYTISTDAELAEVEAATIDEAAEIFAVDDPQFCCITTARELFDAILEIGDGAWCWIDTPDRGRFDTRYRYV